MNTKEQKELQQELLEIVFNILVENEDSAIETMETRAVEIIKKLKEHINDDVECGYQKKPILDWFIVCDSQGHVRLNNNSLLKFEKVIKDVGGRSQGRAPQPINENEIESIIRLSLEQLNHVRIRREREVTPNLFEENIIMRERRRAREQQMRPNFVREREASLNLLGNRDENITRPSEVPLSLFGNRNENIGRSSERIRAASYFGNRGENITRPRGQMWPRYIRREREVTAPPLSSIIKQLAVVVACIIVGAYFGAIVGMVLAGLCIELGVIATAEPLLLIMSTTAVIGAIVAGTTPMLKLIEMFKGQGSNPSPSSNLESSNTDHAHLNRERVI